MSSNRSSHVVKLTLALLIGAAAGFVVTGALRGEALGQTWQRFAVWSGLRAAAVVDEGAALPILTASVLVGGSEHLAADGRIALPSGTRFQLRLASQRAGTLQLYTINPAGVSSAAPVWSAPVQGGEVLTTPVLRLDGTQGLETMQLRLLAADKTEITRQHLQIWHL